MKITSKLLYFMVVIIILSLVLILGCTPEPTSTGGTVILSEARDQTNGYPPLMASAFSFREGLPALETLLRIDKTGKYGPWLATDYKVDVNAKTLLLTLRKGVKYHDGTDFNAEAVKWNLNQSMLKKQTGTGNFKSIDIVGDYTVRINFSEWDNTAISNLGSYLGMMISPAAFQKNGEDWCIHNLVGTGPFQFVSWQRDVTTKYKKFDGYWQKGKPYIDAITINFIGDAMTRLMALKAGEIDVAFLLPIADAVALQKEGFLYYSTDDCGSSNQDQIPNSADPKSPFANLKVRQAAQYAINTQAVQQALYGKFRKPEAPIQSCQKSNWAYNSDVKGYPYNPEKAKQLLAEAGYPNGFKTKLSGLINPDKSMCREVIQANFKAVGIDAEIVGLEQGKFNEICLKGGTWEGIMEGRTFSLPDYTSLLDRYYRGDKNAYKMMITPDDYLAAIKNAISAPDFETKQKWTREAIKLQIDKYCLNITSGIVGAGDSITMKKYVVNHGLGQTPDATYWTPEEVRLDRK